jgi:hypothetical protein
MKKTWLFIGSFSLLALSGTLFSAENFNDKGTEEIILDLIQNTDTITEALDGIDLYDHPSCYKRCNFGAFLGTVAATSFHLLVMQPALKHIFYGLCTISNLATNCERSNYKLADDCANSGWLSGATTTLSGLFLVFYVGLPCSKWISHHTQLAYDNAVNKRVRKVLEERERALSQNIEPKLEQQKHILRTLLSRPLKKLEIEVRKVIFLNGAMIGNLTLMKSVLTKSEQEVLKHLECLEKESCSICRNDLFVNRVGLEIEQINDCAIITSCHHHFHKRCLQTWLKKGSKICPNCNNNDFKYTHVFELWMLPF